MQKFRATIEIIGINPFVFVPEKILHFIFKQADKSKGPIPICGTVNEKPYKQTLVKFRGEWRLYINASILKNSPERIGESITITMGFDSSDRTTKPNPEFTKALNKNPEAKIAFRNLRPSRQNEIVRYISSLKTKESRDRNIARAISNLCGND